MSRLKYALALLLLAIGLAWVCGHKKPLSTTWTPEDRARWEAVFADGLGSGSSWFSSLGADERRLVLDCMVSRFFARIPGGPAEAERLGWAGSYDIGKRAGVECGGELSQRLEASETWVPAIAPVYAQSCVNERGEEVRAYCDCLARQAPKMFASPADFVSVTKVPEAKRSAADRKRIEEVTRPCLSLLPKPPVAWYESDIWDEGYVKGCVGGGGDKVQAWCGCMAKHGAQYTASPKALHRLIETPEKKRSAADRKRFEQVTRRCREL